MNKKTIAGTAKQNGARYVRKSSNLWVADNFYHTLEDAERGMRQNEIVVDIDVYINEYF